MKETVNVNIGSQAFTLDEDAYRVLRSYLDDIRSRLPEYDTETMGDIEVRIAEIFREIVSSPMRVITLDTVRAAMHQRGHPRTSASAAATPPRRRKRRPSRKPASSTARAPTARSPVSAEGWQTFFTSTRRSCGSSCCF